MRHHSRQPEVKPIYSLLTIMLSPCQLAREMMFLLQDIYKKGGNTPCHGCSYFNGGRCADYQRLSQVRSDFEQRIMNTGRNNFGLTVLITFLITEKKLHFMLVPIALHVITAKNQLVPQEDEAIWDKLKELFPAEGGGIDSDKLGDAIVAKLQELGLPKP